MAATDGKRDANFGRVKLKNVRLSFPHIFEPQQGKPDKETGKVPPPRFNCTFLMDKSDPQGIANIKLLKQTKDEVMKQKWPKGDVKLKPEKLCTRDGDMENYDGYQNAIYCAASSPQDRPPQIVLNRKGGDGKWIEAANDGTIYAGCYVNAIVQLWAQDNEHGKRINATLEVVQYYAPGEAFGASRADANDMLDDDDAGEAGEIDADDDDLI